jgi:hypothetical protein
MKDIAKLNEKQRKWINDTIPDMYSNAYQKQYIKAIATKSLRAAINSKCLDCCCWQRTEVQKCPAFECPLYNLRPY